MSEGNDLRRGVGVGFRLGAELTVSTLVGAVMGYALDWFLGTKPWLMGVGMWRTWSKEWFGLKFIVHDNSGGWKKYFRFSTDHKVVGIQYLVTLVVVFLLAGF